MRVKIMISVWKYTTECVRWRVSVAEDILCQMKKYFRLNFADSILVEHVKLHFNNTTVAFKPQLVLQ